MATNNNPNQPPPPPPPTGGGASGSGGGIGRSAPIRTLPSGPPRSVVPSSLPGGLSTPPLVKSKLALPHGGRAGQPSTSATAAANSTSVNSSGGKYVASAAPVAAARATGRAVSRLPPSHQQQQASSRPPPPSSSQQPPTTPSQTPQYNQNYDPFSSQQQQRHVVDPISMSRNISGNENDPVSMSRKISLGNEHDPVVLARQQQSPGSVLVAPQPPTAAGGGGGGVVLNTPDNSAQLQPHIVSLPPPTSTPFHPLENSAGGQQQSYQAYSQQQQSMPSVKQQQQQKQSLKQPPSTAASATFKLPPQQLSSAQQSMQSPKQQQASPTKKQQQQQSQRKPTTTSTQPSTPEEGVDVFLRGDNAAAATNQPTTTADGIIISSGTTIIGSGKLRPSPLPTNQSTLEKSQTLASRRAWGDVIRVTNEALVGKDVGVYHCCYSELLAAAAPASVNEPLGTTTPGGGSSSLAPNSATIATGSDLEKLRRETCQLIALRFISQLKLRRYVDLGKEVGELGLMPYLPDHTIGSSASAVGQSMMPDNNNNNNNNIPPSPGGGVDGPSLPPPSPGTPGTLGTMGTETSIDMLSSSPVVDAATAKQINNSNKKEHPLAWKEGSIHPSDEVKKDYLPKWVPYGLRILAAHQLQYNDGSAKAIDVLYDMRDRTVRTEYWNTPGMEIWRLAIDNALVNAFVRKKEWRLALKSLEDLLNGLLEDGGGVDREVDWWCQGNNNVEESVSEEERHQMKEVITSAACVELLSRQLLILLQSGAISAADTIQNEIRRQAAKVQSLLNLSSPSMTTLVRVTKELALVRQAPLRRMVNEGLLVFARFNYTDAAKYFRDALHAQRELIPIVSSTLQSQPPGCPTWKDLTSPTLGFDAEPTLTVECLNNLSLCLLYSGHMRSSVQELEGLIREDPCLYLTEGVAFNLCTLYELGSDGEECMRNKKLLQRVAKRFYLHDVGVESFRLG